jgi:hypothetical protein
VAKAAFTPARMLSLPRTKPLMHSAKKYMRAATCIPIRRKISFRPSSGVYQHCSEMHLHRYLAEYDLRFNHRVKLGVNDGEHAAPAEGGSWQASHVSGPH